MPRYIDADALVDEVMERYCKNCDRRKGIKSGKYRIIYEIGGAPCRACGTGDMIEELEDAPTIDADTVARDIATIIENEKDMRVILQNAEQTITEETAIEFLQSTGWLERHDKALTEFLEYLWNVINPNEMEQYWSMFNAREEKSNE